MNDTIRAMLERDYPGQWGTAILWLFVTGGDVDAALAELDKRRPGQYHLRGFWYDIAEMLDIVNAADPASLDETIPGTEDLTLADVIPSPQDDRLAAIREAIGEREFAILWDWQVNRLGPKELKDKYGIKHSELYGKGHQYPGLLERVRELV